MSQLVPISSPALPSLVVAAGERASMRFLEFFAGNIRNPHTRRAYYRVAADFFEWCASAGVPSIAAVQPVHVATWIEASTRELAAPSVKQRLAPLRHVFDWLVNGQVMPVNPAHTVRGPRHVVTAGQTPVLDPAEARALLNSIDASTHAGSMYRPCRVARPRLIGLMVYSFARIGAALGMAVEDVYTQNRRLWVRLREKGGKRHARDGGWRCCLSACACWRMYSKNPQLAIWGLSISRAPLHAYDPLCVGSAGGRRLIQEVRFAQDSPLERAEFEPSVPVCRQRRHPWPRRQLSVPPRVRS
jgi:hypothetical protein